MRSVSKATYDRLVRISQIPMLFVTALFIWALVIDFLPSVSETTRYAARDIELITWVLFAFEYVLLLVLSPSPKQYVRTHIWDLLVVLLPALRILRVVRLLRLVRLLRVATIGVGYGEMLSLAKRTFRKYRLGYVALIVSMLWVIASAVVFCFEHGKNPNMQTLPECLWWGVVTLTGVGYGDLFPVTGEGRVIAAIFMLTGIGLIGIITATIASVFVGMDINQQERETDARFDALEKQLEKVRQELLEALGKKEEKDEKSA
jgi:voltage-gated potassium channel